VHGEGARRPLRSKAPGTPVHAEGDGGCTHADADGHSDSSDEEPPAPVDTLGARKQESAAELQDWIRSLSALPEAEAEGQWKAREAEEAL
jgi:hypothetical protein